MPLFSVSLINYLRSPPGVTSTDVFMPISSLSLCLHLLHKWNKYFWSFIHLYGTSHQNQTRNASNVVSLWSCTGITPCSPLRMPHLEHPNISFFPFIKWMTWSCYNESIASVSSSFVHSRQTNSQQIILLVLNWANPRIFLSVILPMKVKSKTTCQN